MKYSALLFGCLIFFASCKKEEIEVPVVPSAQEIEDYSFINQTVQGKIEGSSWTMKAGVSNRTSIGSDNSFYVELYIESDTNECKTFSSSDRVIFHVPQEVGIYELGYDGAGRTVTLFDEETFNNIIASDGAYEIISIDTLENELTMNIDARSGDDNFINGRFTVPICY